MVDKKELLKIFNNLIKEYRIAEETIIDVMGNLDYSDLEKKINEYRVQFEKAMNL